MTNTVCKFKDLSAHYPEIEQSVSVLHTLSEKRPDLLNDFHGLLDLLETRLGTISIDKRQDIDKKIVTKGEEFIVRMQQT